MCAHTHTAWRSHKHNPPLLRNGNCLKNATLAFTKQNNQLTQVHHTIVASNNVTYNVKCIIFAYFFLLLNIRAV